MAKWKELAKNIDLIDSWKFHTSSSTSRLGFIHLYSVNGEGPTSKNQFKQLLNLNFHNVAYSGIDYRALAIFGKGEFKMSNQKYKILDLREQVK